MDSYFEILHFVHPQHPLTLVDLKDSETRGLIETQRKIKWEKRISDRLRQGLSDVELDVSISCVLCRNEILGTSSYSCTICDIHMHKLCAKLPTKMMHPNNTEHPLTLTERRFRCNICSKSKNGFSYCCSSCDFDVDVKCASRAEAINHKGHPHPLYPVLRTALFKCDACSTEHSAAGVSYMCSTCDFWVHEDCATLPDTVKYHRHVHPLSLVVYNSSSKLIWRRCEICPEKALKHWMYKCSGGFCSHAVHVNCLATTLIAEIRRRKTYEVDPDIDLTKLFRLPESFQYDDLVAQMIKHITTHYGENATFSEDAGPLYHFSHKHPLTLVCNLPSNSNESEGKKKNKKDVLCVTCVLPVSTRQVHYSCTVCNNYDLHEWCAKLPNELQHPSHPHPLILAERCHEKFGLTRCPACRYYSNGFVYICRNTATCWEFAMDVKCLLPPSITHNAHQHPLKLIQNCSKEGCVACRYRNPLLAYGCDSCGFYLHHACALKPVAIGHRYDKHHPFISTSVQPIENQIDEYVCEFCERDINPKKGWFHHCSHCDLSACTDCIFPQYGGKNHLNFHLTYSSDIHDHPLRFVQVNGTNNTSLCPTCQQDFRCLRYALQCVPCKLMFHNENCSKESPKSLFPLVLQEGPSYQQ